jgi:tetratricopeptide (TPR) repeat protein
VLGTFEQTLGLAAEGSRQEAQLGCEFVLRMDPQFEPARRLQERLRDSAGPVRTDDLLSPAAPAEPAFDPFGFDLGGMPAMPGFEDDDLSLDLPDLPGAAPASGPAGAGADLRSQLQALLDGRRFPELMALAERERAAITADPQLAALVGSAQERMEAEPYVQKFLAAAREAARTGNADEVKRALDKARALDPDHPGIAEIAGSSAPAPAPTPAPAFPPSEPSLDLDFGHPSAALDFEGGAMPDLSFGEPAAAGAMPSFDGGFLGGGGGDSESEQRIRQLLAEGQTAYDAGDLQGAIDAWSRIFLIDIDHQEAARRIDQARKLKAESERQVEEVFHDGVAKLEAGDAAGARRDFERALELQPGYFQAREYLQQLDAGQMPVTRPVAAPRDPSEPLLHVPSELDIQGGGELKEEILIPPDPSEMTGETRQRRAAPAPKKAREGRARRLFLLVGSAVLVVVAVAGYLLYQNKDRLFPNSQADDAAVAAPDAANADPIEHATKLHKAGKTSIALAQLKRIAPGDPHYQQAQSLIKQWDVEPASGAAPAGTPAAGAAPAPPPVSPERLALLTSARDAYAQGLYLDATQRFEQAVAGGQLDPPEADMLADARRRLEPISPQIELFRQHEWEHALHDLWRLHESDPGNHDVTRLMIDSYYNLGVRDLQRADPDKAEDSFQEAIKLAPSDAVLKRNLLFSQTYKSRPQDLLYRIYVKHLPVR